MVSVLAFYSNDLSSNPDIAYRFSVKFLFEKNKNRPGFAHFYIKKENEERIRFELWIAVVESKHSTK